MNTNTLSSKALHELVVAALDDNKAIDIKSFDVTHLTDVTDSIVVCTSTSKRHALTLAEKVSLLAKQKGERALSTEGDENSEWILIDFVDVVVHIMLAETREFYSIEKLWNMTESSRQQHN
ncbi:MAG: ribosome silencing factor [Coxiellaceae bacterium]|nr:ribosome silencing factor [Coxiellaceae bacterium]